ncbi:MAG TPA: hypothetical protein VEI01_25160 [Terriglobales bacterium]|nr:hypothetical protein [Terriglobales bacterium]
MKTPDKNIKAFWSSPERMEKLREELRKRISREDLEYSWRLEALDHIITFSQVDPTNFHRLWIKPLLAAGASLEVAIACIADSHFQPN